MISMFDDRPKTSSASEANGMSNLTHQPVAATTATPPAPAMIPRRRTVILSPKQRQARLKIARRKTAGTPRGLARY